MSVPPSPEIATGTSGAATDEAMLAATDILVTCSRHGVRADLALIALPDAVPRPSSVIGLRGHCRELVSGYPPRATCWADAEARREVTLLQLLPSASALRRIARATCSTVSSKGLPEAGRSTASGQGRESEVARSLSATMSADDLRGGKDGLIGRPTRGAGGDSGAGGTIMEEITKVVQRTFDRVPP